MATAAQPQALPQASPLSAEEFARRPDPGHPEELVRGRIIPLPPPKPRHGQICGQLCYLLKRHLEAHDLGHVLSNDSGVITERGPDTVRGADIAFYRYDRVPKGPLPEAYLDVAPDLVFEVLSPSDRWPRVLAKVAEYLEAGVEVVVVLDPSSRSAQVFRPDRMARILTESDELDLGLELDGFRTAISAIFG